MRAPTSGFFSFVFSVSALIDDLNRDVSIAARLDALARFGGTSNLGNTANLSLLAPAGLTFTSESGLFLIAAEPTPAPVGEPASLSLFAVGLLALGAGRRRRQT